MRLGKGENLLFDPGLKMDHGGVTFLKPLNTRMRGGISVVRNDHSHLFPNSNAVGRIAGNILIGSDIRIKIGITAAIGLDDINSGFRGNRVGVGLGKLISGRNWRTI